jgi:hypothetical protein
MKLFIYWGHIPSYIKEPELKEKNRIDAHQKPLHEKAKQYRDIQESTNMIKNNFIYNMNDLQSNIKKIV